MSVPAESAQPELLRFADLHVRFRTRERIVEAVRGVSFTIAAGEVVAVVGESGSGKSVSALSVLRLLPQPPAEYPSGKILWKGEDVLAMAPSRLRRLRGGEVGMIFQEPMTALNPTMTAGAQIDEALALHTTLNRAQRLERVIELLHQVGIPDPASRVRTYPHEMSGGQRQRVCIAMALAARPQLLIADEPTTALDVTIQAQILDLLKDLRQQTGMAVLFITHDLGVVAELADRVVVMRHGQVVEAGPVREILTAAKHPYTKGLLACRPRLGQHRTRLPTVDEWVEKA
ncbi:ABC transporter ATP-binding protein [Planctomycetota bacterium]|nr:ABC transporter ATP-binding protein [Planctomycetota bacterium]